MSKMTMASEHILRVMEKKVNHSFSFSRHACMPRLREKAFVEQERIASFVASVAAKWTRNGTVSIS